jgi:DNA mismatch repair protein MutS2
MATLDSLLTMPSIKSKLATESGGALISEVSGGRLVLPVDAKHASSVGIVHDSSRSGKTVYVEPTEIVGPTNELRQAEGELRAEEARVWRSLTEEILQNRVPLETSVKAIGQLDLVWARLLLGRKLKGVIPIVQNEGVISLRNAKHPVLLLRELSNVVGSDVELGSNGNQGWC